MAKGRGHTPLRTCVVCRAKSEKDRLVRFTVDGGSRLVWDDRGQRPGRGVYVCKKVSCLQGVLLKNRLQRAFRHPIQIEAEAVRALLDTDVGE